MKTYPVWRKLLLWHECFMKRSISASIHTKYQRPVLGRISALFFRQPAALSICLFAASFQVYATDRSVSEQEGANTAVNVPTVIHGTIPIEVDIGNEATMKSREASLASPNYLDLGQQTKTLFQASRFVLPLQIILLVQPSGVGNPAAALKKQQQARNFRYVLLLPPNPYPRST